MKNIFGMIACVVAISAPCFAGATFTFTGQWTTGGQGNFIATNDSGQAMQNWVLEFDWNADVTSLWNGVIQSKVGNHYTVVNAAWNGTVAAGASIEVGCVFNQSPSGVLPTGSTPASRKRFLTSGLALARATSCCTRAMTAAGVCAGAKKPNTATDS